MMAVNDNSNLTLVDVFCKYSAYRRHAGLADSSAHLHVVGGQGVVFELRQAAEHDEVLNFLSFSAHMDEPFFEAMQGLGYAITGQTIPLRTVRSRPFN